MTVRIMYRPMVRWADPVTDPRVDSPFKSGWTDTLDLLRREVDMLSISRDEDCVIEVDTAGGNIRADGGMRADAKVIFDGVIVSFDSRFGPLRYATDTFRRASWQSNRMAGWQCNVRAIALGLEALRKVDRYGISRRGEQYTGWKALGSGVPMPAVQMTWDEACRVLEDGACLAPGVVSKHRSDNSFLAHVAVAYRRAALKSHPDVGGDPEVFKRVTEARDLLTGAGR